MQMRTRTQTGVVSQQAVRRDASTRGEVAEREEDTHCQENATHTLIIHTNRNTGLAIPPAAPG